MPYNFVVTIFKQRNFVADFLPVKCTFFTENGYFASLSPKWGLGGQRMLFILGSLESS